MAYSGHVCPLGREEGGEAHHGGEGYIRNCHSIEYCKHKLRDLYLIFIYILKTFVNIYATSFLLIFLSKKVILKPFNLNMC